MTEDVRRAAVARRWFKLLGHRPAETADAIIVATPDSPTMWDANFAFAKAGADPHALLAALDTAMPHTPWRVVASDALTDSGIEAALAYAGFATAPPLIEMLATGPLVAVHRLPEITIERVETAAGWEALSGLIRADHAEGRRTGAVDDALSAALIASMRTQMPPGSYSLIQYEGLAIGYGLAVGCPGGLGMIEHLFVLPEVRGRGIMSAFLIDAAQRLRAAGCDSILLDARAEEPAKRLYAALGFVPIAVTRSWTRRIDG